MKLDEYIEKYYGGNKSEFARKMGKRRDEPARWIKAGWIVVNDTLYSPRHQIKTDTPSHTE